MARANSLLTGTNFEQDQAYTLGPHCVNGGQRSVIAAGSYREREAQLYLIKGVNYIKIKGNKWLDGELVTWLCFDPCRAVLIVEELNQFCTVCADMLQCFH